jgi:hypothetical protein
MTKRCGLLASMKYTREFYTQKLRQMRSLAPLYEYTRKRSIFADWALVFLLRYLSSVTVVLEKGGATNDRPGMVSGQEQYAR